MTNPPSETKPRRSEVVPSGLWPGSSPELIAAHERTLALVDAEPRFTGRFAQFLPQLAVFTLVLGLSCLLIGQGFEQFTGLGLDELSLERRKYEHYEAQKDSFDVLFVGSSQVYRHIDSPLFDKRLETAGHPLESFNFGLPGMFFPEVLTTIDWILANKSDRLKWMFVELRELEPELVPANDLSRREIHLHSARATALELKLAWQSQRPMPRRWGQARWAARHFLYRMGNVAMAYPLARKLFGHTPSIPPNWPQQGFWAIDEELAEQPNNRALAKRREIFLEDREPYDNRVLHYQGEEASVEPSQLRVGLYRDLVQRIRAAGVEPVFFIGAPGWSKYGAIRRARELGILPNLFEYHDMDEHPEFYRRGSLFDIRHLKAGPTKRFTNLLANDFVAWLEQSESSPGQRDPKLGPSAPDND